MPTCQYCDNSFKTEYNLKTHQRSAMYCLKLRGKNADKQYQCSKCKKKFTTNQWLVSHQKKCGIDIQKILEENRILYERIREKDLQIKELQDKLENIALKAVSRPTTKNTQINNYIQKLECVTDKHFQDQVQHLTIEHIQKGPEGYAEYALEYPLKNRIVCVDYSRRKVKFKDKDGKIVSDPEMATIATKLFQSIKDKNKDLIMTYGNELKDKFGDEMGTVIELLGYKSGVDNGAEGSKSEFYHDFVKSVCGKSVLE